MKKEAAAATTIQAHWRGHQTRSKASQGKAEVAEAGAAVKDRTVQDSPATATTAGPPEATA